MTKLASIEEKLAEYDKEIERLNNEFKPFTYNNRGSGFDTTEYYLQQAAYR